MRLQNYEFYVKRENIFEIICFLANILVTQQRKMHFFFVFAARKFANIGNYAYLCSVKIAILAIQVSFLRGQAVYVTTQF